MTKYSGNDFALRIGTSTTAGTLVANMKTTSFSADRQPIDITDKDSNSYRELLSGKGRKQLDISADGLMSDSTTIDAMMTHYDAGTSVAFGLNFGDSDRIDGSFIVTNFSAAGPVDDAQTYSVALQSTGSWTLTTA